MMGVSLPRAAELGLEFCPLRLEWHFARACGYRFRISVDNLHSDDSTVFDTAPFKARVLEQARHWQSVGLPGRAGRFARALHNEFGLYEKEPEFTLAELD